MSQESGSGTQRRRRVAGEEVRADRRRRAARWVEQGLAALREERVDPARRKFRRAVDVDGRWADARAYLALTHLLLERWEAALEEAERTLEADPAHLTALTVAARAHAGAGRPVEAHRIAVRTLRRFYAGDRGASRTPDEVALVAEMLVFMGADRRLHQLYRRRVRGVPGSWDASLLAKFGVAAFNRGAYRDARWAWRTAKAAAPERGALFDAYLFVNELSETERIPPLPLDYRLQGDVLADDGGEPPGYLKVFALHSLWHSDDEATRRASLELLTSTEEESAAALLAALLGDDDVPSGVKRLANAMLADIGFVMDDEFPPSEEPFAGPEGEMDDPRGGDIFGSVTAGLDEEIAAVFDEALQADAQGRGDVAVAGYRAVLQAVPDFVPALLGLAAVYERRGRLADAEELLQRALGQAPDDPVIRFHLAAVHMQRNRLEDAWRRLRTMRASDLPPGVRAGFYWMYGQLALVMDRPEDAESAFQQGLREDPDNEELLAGFIAAGQIVAENRRRTVQAAARRRRRHETRPIRRDVPWVEAVERLTLPRLRAVARRLGVLGAWSMRKVELAEAVTEVLRAELGSLWLALAPREQAALRWIDARGGCVPYSELRRRFGDDSEDSFDWLDNEPETVPMRLQFFGLLFVGRLEEDGEPAVVLPREARQALKFAKRRTT